MYIYSYILSRICVFIWHGEKLCGAMPCLCLFFVDIYLMLHLSLRRFLMRAVNPFGKTILFVVLIICAAEA